MDGVFIRTSNRNYRASVAWLLSDRFGIAVSYIDSVLSVDFDRFMAHLKDDLVAFVEPVYVDKVYRDSYYTYYASKLASMPKNCIRISFFEDEEHQITEGDMDFSQFDYLKGNYRGFVVLRPTMSSIIGRNAISPEIVKDYGFKICKTTICSTAGGFKFEVEAFPAAAQDTETMTCAETTVWAMMEYFGNRYAEYTPLLPSNIVNILKQTTIERQLPSNGLTEDNLSFIAKSCGFGSQLYHRDYFPDFYNILSCYIESGIPVMVALSNNQYINDQKAVGLKGDQLDDFIGHAVMCIGHETVTEGHIDNTSSENLTELTMLDYDNIEKRFVFIDDNFPPYMMDSLTQPTGRYALLQANGQPWDHCLIDHFVAPLYRKVYLEPKVAKGYLKELIQSPFMKQLHKQDITMRVFLCSTRSYREYINHSSMSDEMKRMVARLTMPKFIWVAELSDRSLLKQGIAKGIILLDATECKTEYHNALLVSMCEGEVLCREHGSLKRGLIKMNQFNMYNNLK